MKAITIGSTGAVGRDLLTVLASDPDFERVDVLVRRLPQLPSEHAEKFHVHIIDFEHPETWKSLVTGDVLFSSLGTSKKQAGGKSSRSGASITTTSSRQRRPRGKTACRRWSSSHPLVRIPRPHSSTSR